MDTMTSSQRGRSRSGNAHATHNLESGSSSSPIEIPRKRTPLAFDASSSLSQPLASDMIFDMSPVTSEFSFSSHRPLFSMPQNNEKFLYNFPTLSPPMHQRSPVPSSSSPKIPPESASPLSVAGTSSSEESHVAGHSIVKGPASRRVQSSLLDEYDLLLKEPPFHDGATSINRSRGCASAEDRPHLEPLSPGPRRSCWSSPWILPGKEESPEEESVLSEMPDAPVFEFQHHLLRRIDKFSRSRIAPYNSYM